MKRESWLARLGVLAIAAVTGVAPAAAQEVSALTDEDLEPRVVGHRGLTQIGLSGSLDGTRSSSDTYPTHLELQVGATRFITNHIAARLGVVGAYTFGGSASTDERQADGSRALHASAATLYFFTPGAVASPYAGAEYLARITDRRAGDKGSVSALAGLQLSLSSRSWLFVEGGYGIQLTRDEADVLQRRITGTFGVRFRF